MLKRILFFLVSLLCVSRAFSADQQPNIIIFLVDDMGVMDTSLPFLTDSEGQPKKYPLNEYYRTPNMEELARRGIRFNNFCAMSVCSPTRVSIQTGQNATRHRTTNWINPDNNNGGPLGPANWNWQGLKPGDVTLAALLKSAGYQTIHVGKGHFAPRNSPGADPKNIGFAENVAGASIGAPASYYGKNGYGNQQENPKKKKPGNAVNDLEKYHGTETFLTDALTAEANEKIAAAVAAKKPFYLNLAHYAVHAPFNSDPRFAANYKDSGKPPPAQAFATLIEGMDKSLGDLLAQLDKLGIAENTLVFFLGDNGSDAPLGHQHAVACAAPLRGKKGSHYEGGMRVPFIAAWARPNIQRELQQRLPIPRGTIQSQLASVCDLFPTILELTEVAVPRQHKVDGHSLKTLLAAHPDADRPETFLMHYPHAPHRSDYWTSYRAKNASGEWKVIYHYFPSEVSENSHYQLFNLADDPFEQKNLATSEPDQLRRMMRDLIDALAGHNAVYPHPKDDATPLLPKLP